MLLIEGDLGRGVSNKFLFLPKKLDSYFRNSRIIVVNGYHIDVTTGIHSKLVLYGGC